MILLLSYLFFHTDLLLFNLDLIINLNNYLANSIIKLNNLFLRGLNKQIDVPKLTKTRVSQNTWIVTFLHGCTDISKKTKEFWVHLITS